MSHGLERILKMKRTLIMLGLVGLMITFVLSAGCIMNNNNTAIDDPLVGTWVCTGKVSNNVPVSFEVLNDGTVNFKYSENGVTFSKKETWTRKSDTVYYINRDDAISQMRLSDNKQSLVYVFPYSSYGTSTVTYQKSK